METWFHTCIIRWYEVDEFIAVREERHGFVRNMLKIDDRGLSDHMPKGMNVKVEKWTVGEQQERNIP